MGDEMIEFSKEELIKIGQIEAGSSNWDSWYVNQDYLDGQSIKNEELEFLKSEFPLDRFTRECAVINKFFCHSRFLEGIIAKLISQLSSQSAIIQKMRECLKAIVSLQKDKPKNKEMFWEEGEAYQQGFMEGQFEVSEKARQCLKEVE